VFKKYSNFGETKIKIAKNKNVDSTELKKNGYEINLQNSKLLKIFSVIIAKFWNKIPFNEKLTAFIKPIKNANSKEKLILLFFNLIPKNLYNLKFFTYFFI
jgi:hypothetical protein